VALARREGLKSASEASGWSASGIRRWCQLAGVQWKVFEREKRHGTVNGNCPCDLCVEARRAAAKRDQQRRVRLQRAGKMPKRIHGTPSGYMNWKCRCDKCKAAGAEQNRNNIAAAHARREAGLMPKKYHGTSTGYAFFGCRCRRCRAGQRARIRA
jgi:hypothetical protein